jgi:hypothetical protein
MTIPLTNTIQNDCVGYASSKQLAIIEHFSKEIPEGAKIVEIGCFLGRSTWHWAKCNPTATVYAIDLWDESYLKHRYANGDLISGNVRVNPLGGNRTDRNNVKVNLESFLANVYDCPNIVPIKAKSPDGIPAEFLDVLTKLDVVYIDDSHENPGFQNNLNFWWPRLRGGGIFCGDDFAARDVCTSVVQLALRNRQQIWSRDQFWRVWSEKSDISI